jgi:4-hydroxy-tetrahydrodipicolinate synthase
VTAPRFHAAITTPFAEDGLVDIDAFEAHVAWLADAGLDGVFVAGTTGEGVLLEEDEVAALVERALGHGVGVIAQVGRPSTAATARLARRAIGLGADGVAAYVPWFYPAGDAEARTHFHGLLEAAGDTPAYLYNIPRRTVNDLTPELAAELARAGFAGMKDSTGDFKRHEAYLDALDGTAFDLYVGSEPLVLRAFRRGSAGAITGLASARPELFVALRDALAAGDDATAEHLQAEIAGAKAEIGSEGSTVAGVKRRVAAALADRGVTYPPTLRPPFA